MRGPIDRFKHYHKAWVRMRSFGKASTVGIQHNQTGKTIALSYALALLLAAIPHAGQAETPGVVINKEGGSVYVIIDPSVVPNLANRERRDGQMIFEVPDASLLKVDPALKNTVQVKGKQVIINSDQVYLGTQDLSNMKATPSVPAKPAPSVAGKPATFAKPIVQAQQPVIPARPATTTRSTVPLPSTPRAQSTPITTPVAVRPATQSFNRPRPAPVASAPVIIRQNPATTVGSAPAIAPSPPAGNLAGYPQEAATQAGMRFGEGVSQPLAAQAPLLTPAPSPEEVAVSDPETLPLDYMDTQREEAAKTSMELMARLAVGLIAVLLMAVIFTRTLLPRLVAQYPEFFNRLQRKDAVASVMEREMERPQPQPKAPRQAKTPKAGPLAKKEGASSSKKHYLAQMRMDGDQFTVITSQDLGRGKELHLVEIKGRQLVIATTPFNITLIKDLSEPPTAAEQTDEGVEPTPEPEPQVSGLLESSKPVFDTAFERASRMYADDEPVYEAQPTQRYSRVVSKRYASGPTDKPVTASTEDAVYKKYLDAEELAPVTPERIQAQKRQRDISEFLAHDRHVAGPVVDAEEVVVLEDYDDQYYS